MHYQEFLRDKSVSILRGIPLSEEPGLGELTVPGFIRQVAERFSARQALVQYRSDGTRERWSYRDLWEHSVDVAKALVAGGGQTLFQFIPGGLELRLGAFVLIAIHPCILNEDVQTMHKRSR